MKVTKHISDTLDNKNHPQHASLHTHTRHTPTSTRPHTTHTQITHTHTTQRHTSENTANVRPHADTCIPDHKRENTSDTCTHTQYTAKEDQTEKLNYL